MATTDDFFEESREQSRIKSRIVAKYFSAWARIIAPRAKRREKKIAYLDLFAGPGKYEDGTPSTPLIVLQTAIKDPDLREMLVTVFNDKRREFTDSLRQAISEVSGIETLRHRPIVENEEVGRKVVDKFRANQLVPTFLFVDPWGYRGLSVSLIASVLQNWGCDCVFFFNYNRINPGLSNDAVRNHMNDLFGTVRANIIRTKLAGLEPDEREALIIEELTQGLKEAGITYLLPFSFKNESGVRTKHHLIFSTKNFTGYEIMKEIMAGERSEIDQGVASFAYSKVREQFQALFEFSRPLSDLERMLLNEFSGQRLTMKRLYELHSVGRPFIKKNYKDVLIRMEADNKIKATPPAAKRRENTFGADVTVTFPQKAN